MKNQLQYFICRICAFLFLPLTGLGQDIHFDLVQRPEDQAGLLIYSMVQDNRGFLWIGTFNGLYKYDGIRYTDYHSQPTKPNSMSGDWIECLAADKQGYIWVGYYHSTSGLDRLDPSTGIWAHFRHKENDIYSIACDSVSAIMQDHEGTIWVGTPGGLDRFDSRTNRFYHYQHAEKDSFSLSCNQVRTIYEDKEGVIWVGTGNPWPIENQRKEGGLNKLDRTTGKFTRYLHNEKDPHSLSDNRIGAIFEDSRGNFWVGSAGDGLHKMDRKNGSFERLLYDPAHPDGLSRPPLGQPVVGGDDHITFITEDNSKRLWIGTLNGGINVYDPAIKKSTWYGSGKNSKEKLQDNTFWAVCKTKDGLIWIGNFNSNLYKASPYKVTVPYTRVGSTVWAFAEDNAKTLWLATNRGLVHQDSLGTLHWFMIEKDSAALRNAIRFIEKDDHNRLWLTTSHGLYYIDPGTDKIFKYKSESANDKSLLTEYINIVSKSKDGYLWIGTSDHGLQLLNVKSGAIIQYEHNPADSNSISSNAISSITTDKNENLWVGTNRGLNRLKKQNGHFKRYLDNLSTMWVQEDSAGDIWAGTVTGFFRYDRNRDSFLPFTDPTGLIKSNNAVFGIAEDPHQFLWLTTWRGILQLSKDRNAAVMFGANQGINPIVLTNIEFTRQNGDVICGDSAGFYTFSIEQLKRDTSRPTVSINSFLLNDVAVEPSPHGILTAPLEQTELISLNHDQNTFSLGFSIVDFVSNLDDSRSLYMLQNYDDNWRSSNENRSAYYFNLPPGKYVFKVKAVGANGRSTEKQIGIIITPPWWTTWWAYTIYFLTLLAGILITDRIRRKVVIEREQAKTKERELAQAKEIEKAYTELKATQSQLIQSEKMASLGELTAGIAHEIQNPLNFVNNFSEVNRELLQEMKTELMQGNNHDAMSIADNVIANEEKINRHGQRADAIVKGMLQHSRSDTGIKEPTNINALADEYLRLSYHGLRARDKSFNATLHTDFDQHIGPVNIIPQDIGRMLLNLFNNAFYAVSEKKKNIPAGYEPTVSLSTKKVNNKVEIRVRDNGNGIPAKIKGKIFQPFFTTKPTGQGTGLGLSLNYDIVKAHGGEISVDSKEGEFTEFVIVIPMG